MSYQVLARKWRPAKFEQMVGQSHVLMALTNALSQQRLHHAYLFTGTRGVGKTSLARLFAKGLNCETGVTANPCGECSSCIEIAQGRFVDLIEVDAASRTKVDDTRELLDNVQYRPSRGRYKVYLIDEVHMLSRSSFNALLKTLEEPPEHVKFLLATTDPHKLPVTVLSRCLQFNLKSLSQQEISQQLEFVITQEQLPFEQQALTLLAKAANGSMRDALSLTDQAIAFGSGQVMLEQVQTMLGSIDEQHVIALLKALCDADVGPLMQMVAKVLAFGADAEEVLRSLLELLHQITLTQFAPAAAQQSLFAEQILAFAQQLAPEQVQLYYQMLLNGRKDLAFAPDPKSGLEMALLRAVAFTPEKQVKRWVTTSPAAIDLSATQEVADTGPKPENTAALSQSVSADIQSDETSAKVIESPSPIADTHSDDNAQAAMIQPPEPISAEDDELESTDPALSAEQSLLVSQAESLGYQSQAELVPAVNDAQQASTTVAVEADTFKSEPLTSEAQEDNNALEKPVVHTEPESEPIEVSVQLNTDAVIEPASNADPFDGYSFNDFDQDADYQPSDHDDYLAYSAQNDTGTFDAIAPEQQTTPSTSAEDEPNAEKTAAKNDFEDLQSDTLDFLDMVLASRDSLLADVDALQQKEQSASKASSATKTSFGPKAKTSESHVSPQVTPQQSPAEIENLAPVKPESNSPTPAISATVELSEQSNTQSQPTVLQDRAPWVKPEPGEEITAFADVAGKPDSEPQSAKVDVQVNASVAVNQHIDAQPLTNTAQASAREQTTELVPFTPHSIEGNELDLHWYKVMTHVSVGGRVRQLGVNSVFQAHSNPIVLVLKPDQKHLSAPIAIDQLQVALTEYLQQPIEVQIQIGVVANRETPLELRKRFHRELIAQAEQSILQDDNTQWMIQRLSAQLDSDSIEYPPEQLAQIAQDIAQITVQ
ncbi:DNA polymerase III subunit gamma/tau [Shewanella saliphila]|uniref:DNA-directed DNA polymerase n=1 Tax=Shewanella saliphila TaxID=2282698 RepID=A0ABQ2Q9L2_9GAMM|nr:DNA polymerase III subunit gamma/tau [Shewanella saliphila]MCL1102842.1 DNA polymerase III subunit gamma/tau [Shewanella saliphila]GGP62081.1 DNA polymerase III subunit gamma/tau [Shewanella saliphila]